MSTTDDVGEFVSENSELIGRVLACGDDEARACALGPIANSGDPDRVDEVQGQPKRSKREMEWTPTKAVSGRMPADVAVQLEQGAEETNVSKPELVARAAEHDIEENPDDLRTVHSDDPFAAYVGELC